jgi:hypothetical protein
MHEILQQDTTTLKQKRLLVESGNLLIHRQLDGSYPQEVLDGILDNLVTKVQEDAMSSAVSRSFQPANEVKTAVGETRRSFIWRGLGKTAVQVAESGFAYHWSQEAHQRVKIEVKESVRSEEELKPGIWQTFISPRMSSKDADKKLAEAEHLADEDAIRCSYAVTNEAGEIVGRKMVSILVRDIPLSAWVSMLSDPNNIFGRAFAINDPDSALGVMELFSQLDLPLDTLPEGPVTLVGAVKSYITQPEMKSSVEIQLADFRQDQEKLHKEATYTANKWLEFIVGLTDSLATGVMQKDIKVFVYQLQNEWPKEVLTLLKQHESESNGYNMSVQLAAVLEEAWEKINLAKAAVMVDDKRSLKGISNIKAAELKEQIQYIRVLDQGGAISAAQYAVVTAQLNRRIAYEEIKTGGGCGPKNEFKFGKKRNPKNPSYNGNDTDPNNLEMFENQQIGDSDEEMSEDEGIGNIHFSRCRTGYCPSDDKVVKVGGCDVCLAHCQPEFDKGNDPAEVFAGRANRSAPKPTGSSWLLQLFNINKAEVEKPRFFAVAA